jgi:hypothetical protein
MENFFDEIPDWIDNDDNFLYHGSSNISEDCIEKLKYNQFCHFKKEEIDSIIDLYKKINWYGSPGGGFQVLSTFSISDFENNLKPLFLANQYNRCLLYAHKDFAGGELVRSIFYAIKDLNNYIDNDNIRNEHKKFIEDNFQYNQILYDVNLEVLKEEVKNLNDIYQKSIDIRNLFEYGIIYCFKITPDLYQYINNPKSMGYTTNLEHISNHLKAKIIVDKKLLQIPLGNFIDKQLLSKIQIWDKRLK